MIRHLHATARRSLRLPEVEKITQKEYQIAAKLRSKSFPPCHREFLDVINSLANNDYDCDHPKVVEAVKTMEACTAEARQARKGQKSSLNYHLSRYLKR